MATTTRGTAPSTTLAGVRVGLPWLIVFAVFAVLPDSAPVGGFLFVALGLTASMIR